MTLTKTNKRIVANETSNRIIGISLSETKNDIAKKMNPIIGKYFQNGIVRSFHSCQCDFS
jgi:hypothetical protein